MRIWVSIGLAGLALAGCGGQDAAPANGDAAVETAEASGAGACEVLTQADAAKALGREVDKMAGDGGPAALDMCQYGYQGERMMDTDQATVTVQPVDLASLKKGVTDQGFAVEPVGG